MGGGQREVGQNGGVICFMDIQPSFSYIIICITLHYLYYLDTAKILLPCVFNRAWSVPIDCNNFISDFKAM